jgi:apolipoprotein N-acyltransferase
MLKVLGVSLFGILPGSFLIALIIMMFINAITKWEDKHKKSFYISLSVSTLLVYTFLLYKFYPYI